MKKLALVLAVLLMLGLFAGCAEKPAESKPAESTPAESTPADPDNPYAHLDLSEEETIIMYTYGNEPTDMAEILEMVNARTKEAVNATIDLYFVPGSEVSTKYPLIMAGGDEVDLIYTANWCYYKEQVEKAGFTELTEDFIQTYMPQTYATLPPAAWEETKINGKMYLVPRNTAAIPPDVAPIINFDYARQFGYEPEDINSFEKFEEMLLAIADNIDGVYAYYASQSSTMGGVALTYKNNLINNQAADFVYYCQLDDPTFENPFFLYTSDYYKEYALRMAKYAAAHVWPADAITNTNSVSTLFSNGQSAVRTNNFYNGINTVASLREAGMDVYMVDIWPEGYRVLRDSYIGDGYAIPIFSTRPERAAVLLDYIKTDLETYMLLAGGVEGRHYIYDTETNTVDPGPESGDYEFDGWAWGIRHKDFPWPKTDDEFINAANERIYENQVKDEEWKYWGFTFDYAPVAAEWAVISSIQTEYGTSFSLGNFGADTEAKLAEMEQMMVEGGLEKYMAEWHRQREEFLANK